MIFGKRSDAKKRPLADGDTLAKIALAEKLEPRDLALFNFGTADPDALNRILFEAVGFRGLEKDPLLSRFEQDKAPKGKFELLIPAPFQAKGLAVLKTHKVNVRRPRTFVAIEITALDKWFLPGPEKKGGEACRVEYRIEGAAPHADQVDFEVHASNYCEASMDEKGVITWGKALPDVPVYQREAAAPADFSGGGKGGIADWRGESTAESGALAKGKEGRHVNVAFSPYTVLLRARKAAPAKDGDRAARIDVDPFWVRFDDEGHPIKQSCEIGWTVRGCDRLKYGKILVIDADDRVVFEEALAAPGGFPEGERQTLSWSGKGNVGRARGHRVKPDKMPYRVQVQLHTDWDEEEGLALAAMHTEVRMFVHPETGSHKKAKDPDKQRPWFDPSSLAIGLAPFAPKAPDRAPGDKLWATHRLALAGYHPGPLGHGPEAPFWAAIREFKRSHPKPGGRAGHFQKLPGPDNADIDPDTEQALADATPGERPMFAELGTLADIPDQSPEDRRALGKKLSDPAGKLCVWVDDRHHSTSSVLDWLPKPDDDYRGSALTKGDRVLEADAQYIARPCIPVEARIPLLRRAESLAASAVDLDGLPPETEETMRRAVGPLRVSWSFDEIDPDVGLIDDLSYDEERARPRAWAIHTLIHMGYKENSGTPAERRYTNCPDTGTDPDGRRDPHRGGIRPKALADVASYCKRAFSSGKSKTYSLCHLAPWKTFDDPGTRSVCSLVHDDLGQKEVYSSHLGKAGVYLVPSRIAGDGYRYNARVSFAPIPDQGRFPNADVLAARYPELPAAHTAALRVFRKSSVRGLVQWFDAAEAGKEGFDARAWTKQWKVAKRHFLSCHMHLAIEGGADIPTYPITDPDRPTRSILRQADFEAALEGELWTRYPDFKDKKVALSPACMWPFSNHPHLGFADSAHGAALDKYIVDILDKASEMWNVSIQLMSRVLVERFEKIHGKLRGYLIIRGFASPAYDVVAYKCVKCKDRTGILKENGCGGEIFQIHRPGEAKEDTLDGVRCQDKKNCVGEYKENGRVPQRFSFPAVASLRGLVFMPLNERVRGGTLAHEMAHCRFLHHANAKPGSPEGPGGPEPKEHDSVPNPNLKGLKDAPHNLLWDRCCLMSYTNTTVKKVSDFEKQHFCGKCVLKLRGWEVESIPDVPGDIS